MNPGCGHGSIGVDHHTLGPVERRRAKARS
jgi:hypothetical protein